MTSSLNDKEKGAVQAVLHRFETQRLPQLLQMKAKVSDGGILDDNEIEFLGTCIDEARGNVHFAEQHPEFATLVARVNHLYNEITQTALKNTAGL